MKIFQVEQYVCKLGQNAHENEQMLNNIQDDNYFFHLTSFPSGFVILECMDPPDANSITQAAQICKEGTKYRKIRNIKVDYCPCSNVTKGATPGEVTFQSLRKVKQIKI